MVYSLVILVGDIKFTGTELIRYQGRKGEASASRAPATVRYANLDRMEDMD